jgi:hypothetical protein
MAGPIMAKAATETAGLRGGKSVRAGRSGTAVRFYALDGTVCVQIEAESEDDAYYLCRDVRLEFIGFCRR